MFDVDPFATDEFIRNLSAYSSLKVTRAAFTKDAMLEADIATIVAADKTYASIITLGIVKRGMYLNAVDRDSHGKTELYVDVLRADCDFVEYEPEAHTEGDIQQLLADAPFVDRCYVLAGTANATDQYLYSVRAS